MLPLFALLIAVTALPAEARQTPAPPQVAPAAGSQVLRVFIDCPQQQCSFDNIRQDVPYVNYVRDRTDADVHVLITTQGTATGGREYTFSFIGLGRFEDVKQTLTYASGGSDMEDEQRRGVTRTLGLGLAPYVLRTPDAGRFSMRYAGQTGAAPAAQPADDPWNFWIFRVGSSVELNGEERQNSRRTRVNLSANRTTDRWKFSFSGNGDFSRGEFTLSDGRVVLSSSEFWHANGAVIKSIGREHWALAFRSEVSSSTQSNEKLEVRQSAGVEWDYFPYSESTRRSFVVQYSVGVSAVNYYQQTLFGKDEETLKDHRLAAILALRLPWGTWRGSAAYQAYLHDLSKNNLDFFADTDVRLFRGFSLSVEGSYARVRNQLYLPAGTATDEEVLLRLRRLATGYRYRLVLGFNYQFGSIYNNVVNPRWSATTGRGF